MPTATRSRLGIMIREIRERAGLTQEAFAKLLSLREASVRRLEAGSSRLLSKSSFYQRLRDVPGFTDLDVTNLLLSQVYASDWFTAINQREHTTYTQLRSEAIAAIDKHLFNYYPGDLDPHEPIQLAFSDDFSIVCGILPDRKRRYLVISVVDYDTIRSQTVSTWMESGELLPSLEPEQQGDPSAIQGRNAPEPGLEQPSLGAEARKPASPERTGRRKRGVVYERELAQFKREYLQESAKLLSELLITTLQNSDDPLSPVAEEALRIFTKAALKEKGITLNKASRELHISVASLSDFVRKGLVPILYRNKGAIYLAKSTAKELGRDLEDAREMGMQPARLLRERREKYFPKTTK
jgi:transcriptional regulator with XRE-family HTH domain